MCWYIHHTCQLIWEEKAGGTKQRQHALRRTCSVPRQKATPRPFMALMRMMQKSLSRAEEVAVVAGLPLQTKRAAAKITKKTQKLWAVLFTTKIIITFLFFFLILGPLGFLVDFFFLLPPVFFFVIFVMFSQWNVHWKHKHLKILTTTLKRQKVFDFPVFCLVFFSF